MRVPHPPDLAGLLGDFAGHPGDPVPRAVLRDYLLDHDDPRGDLLAVVPALMAVPRRGGDGLRPDVPCRVFRVYDGGGVTSTRGEWPRMTPPRPFGDPWAYRGRQYRGVRNLGRLCAVAFYLDWQGHMGGKTYKATARCRFVALCELYACRLIGARDRDGDYVRGVTKFHVSPSDSFTDWLLWRLRSGPFHDHAGVAEWVAAHDGEGAAREFGLCTAQEYAIARLTAAGRTYSRLLDMHDEFARTAPWSAARDAWLRFGNVRPRR